MKTILFVLAICVAAPLCANGQSVRPTVWTEGDGDPRVTAPSQVTLPNGSLTCAGARCTVAFGTSAPTDATYITQTPNATLSAEQALSLLSSGIMRVATTTGVITSLGDQLPLANGGTGASLSDPGANRLLGWDDTDNAVKFFVIGSGLSYDAGSDTLSASGSSLTSTQVGFGSGTNLLTGSTAFTYNDTTKTLSIVNGSGSANLILNGSSDTSKVNFGGASAPGNQGGILFPFVGGGNSSGPGIWWASSASYGSMSGLYLNNGLTFQGANSTHDPLKIAEGTGTSSNGTVRYTLAPSSSLFTQNLSTGVTSVTHDAMQTDLTSSGGAGAANLGIGHLYRIENGSSSLVNASRLTVAWAVATAGSETGRFTVANNNAGGGVGDSFVVEGDQFYNVRNTANITGAATINLRDGNVQELTLTGNVTSTTVSNLKDGGMYWIIVKQDATGSRTLASSVIKAPGGDLTLTAAANSRDLFLCTSDGTSLFCSKSLDIR